MIKICDTCGEGKSQVYFYLDNNSIDKRSSKCMACVNIQKKIDKRKQRRKIKADERRTDGNLDLILYKRRSKTRVAKATYEIKRSSMFMQFNHLIYKHVKDKYGLTFSQVNLLLFIAPITPFPRRDFLTCREVMGYKELGLMKFFIDNDYIYIWKKSMKSDRIPTLYDLTTKGRELVKNIHDWALGISDIPEINDNKALDLMARLYQHKRS